MNQVFLDFSAAPASSEQCFPSFSIDLHVEKSLANRGFGQRIITLAPKVIILCPKPLSAKDLPHRTQWKNEGQHCSEEAGTALKSKNTWCIILYGRIEPRIMVLWLYVP